MYGIFGDCASHHTPGRLPSHLCDLMTVGPPRPEPSPLPPGLDITENSQVPGSTTLIYSFLLGFGVPWADSTLGLITQQVSLVEDKIISPKQISPRISTAEHYASKASELLIELRNADKRFELHELEYQQQERRMSEYVTKVCPASMRTSTADASDMQFSAPS